MAMILYSNTVDPTSATISEGRTTGGLVDADTELGLPIPPRLEDPDYNDVYYSLSGLSWDRNLVGIGTGTSTTNCVPYTGNVSLKDIWTDDSQYLSFFMYSGDSNLTGNATPFTMNVAVFIGLKSGSSMTRGVSLTELNDQFPPEYINTYIQNYQTLNLVDRAGINGLDMYGATYRTNLVTTSEEQFTAATRTIFSESHFDTDEPGRYPWHDYSQLLFSDYVYQSSPGNPIYNSIGYRPVIPSIADPNGYSWPVPEITPSITGFNYMYVLYKFTQVIGQEHKHYYKVAGFELPDRFNSIDLYYGIDQDTLKLRPFHGLLSTWNPEIDDFSLEITNKKNSGYTYTVADKITSIAVVQDDVDQFGMDWYYPGGDGFLVNGTSYGEIDEDEGLVSNTTVTIVDNTGATYQSIAFGNSLIAHFSKRVKTGGQEGYNSTALMNDDEILKVNLTGTVESSILASDSGTCTGEIYVLHTKLYEPEFFLSGLTYGFSGGSVSVKAGLENVSAVMKALDDIGKVDSNNPGLINYYVNWGDGTEETIQWKSDPFTSSTHSYKLANKTYNVYVSAATVEQLDVSNPGYPVEVFERNMTVYTKPIMNIREDGLGYWWGFDGTDWLKDKIGNANLTAIGGQAQYLDGIIGGCMEASSAGYCQLEHPAYTFCGPHSGSSSIDNDWTVSFWFKDPNIGSFVTNDRIALRWNVGGTDELKFGYTVEADGQHYLLFGNKQTTFPSSVWEGSPTLNDTTWKHLSYVKDGTRIKFFLDGELIYQQTMGDINYGDYTSGDWFIGDATTEMYLDDFRIYNRALTTNEVHELSKAKVFDQNYFASRFSDSDYVVYNGVDDNGNWANHFKPNMEYDFTPYVEDINVDSNDGYIRYYSGSGGYILFQAGVHPSTLSLSDDDGILGGDGDSNITISFSMYRGIGGETRNFNLFAITTGSNQVDQIFNVSITGNVLSSSEKMSVGIKTNSGNYILTDVAPRFIYQLYDGKYTIQISGEDGRLGYRFIRDKAVVSQGTVVDPSWDFRFNFSGLSDYSLRLFPKYNDNSYSVCPFWLRDLTIYKTRVKTADSYRRKTVFSSIEEDGSFHYPVYASEDDSVTMVSITGTSSTSYRQTVTFSDFNELGPTDGMIGYYKFDGNLDDSSFSGYSFTGQPDGLHRYFDEGYNRRTQRGLYLYGDVYATGVTQFASNQSHTVQLSEDVQLSGTVFMVIKDLDYNHTTSSALRNVDLFSLEDDIGLVTAYGNSVLTGGQVFIKTGPGAYVPTIAYVADSGWNTYTLTWDNSVSQNIYYYKNGSLKQVSTYTIASPLNELTILDNQYAETDEFNIQGVVGELRVYNRNLDSSEILQLDNLFRKEMSSIDSGMTLHTVGHIKER